MKHALTFACVLIASVVCTGPLRGQDAPNAEDARSHELLPDQERQFSKLAVKFKVDSAAFWAEFKEAKASDDESEDALFREKYPPNSMVDEFLELESKSRSTHVGFSCLYHLLAVETWCFAAPEWAVTKGKQQALLILGEHYHSYPDVDTTFRLLFSGAQIAESDAFLRELIANSRLDYVKANAMFALADNLATESNLPAFIESSVSVLDANVPEQKDTLAHFDRFAALLRIVDDKKCRDEAIVLLERLSQDYPNILEPPRAETRTPALIQVARSELDAILNENRKPIIDRIPSVKFELQYGVGREAPDINQDDVFDKPMRLSQYRGNVVVLMFSFKGCGACEQMYPRNRELIKELAGAPFVFLGVMSDEKIDTVIESVNDNIITWRVWWDGDSKSISRRWNIQEWPETYVIDKGGIIRFRGVRGDVLANAVRKLLE